MNDITADELNQAHPLRIYRYDLPTMICRECNRQGCFTAEETPEGTDLICKCGHTIELLPEDTYYECNR
jgi:ArsR family metal-binding transcriptional regulator